MSIYTFIAYYIDIRLNNKEHLVNGYLHRNQEQLQNAVEICMEMEEDDRFAEIIAVFRESGISEANFNKVLEQLLIGEMNWARFLTVLTLSGALAAYCKDHGDTDKTVTIKEWATAFIKKNLENWIDDKGGMVYLNSLFSFDFIRSF